MVSWWTRVASGCLFVNRSHSIRDFAYFDFLGNASSRAFIAKEAAG